MLRLPQQENEIINRSIELEFTWNGKPYTGYEGDTIASALAAHHTQGHDSDLLRD